MGGKNDDWDYIAEKCYWETHGEPGEVLDDDDDEDEWEEEDNDWYE